jgi:hypothetical protein
MGRSGYDTTVIQFSKPATATEQPTPAEQKTPAMKVDEARAAIKASKEKGEQVPEWAVKVWEDFKKDGPFFNHVENWMDPEASRK